MTGVLVLSGTAPEQEWLDARRYGVTASEIPVLMGLASGEWGSPYKLYFQKTGDLPADDQTDRLRLGHVLEPYIAERFGERRPGFWAASDGRTLYAQGPDRPWQLATPDRLLFERPPEWLGIPASQLGAGLPDDVCAVLETKSWGTFDGWGPDGSDEIPVHIRCQVLWQMDVIGVDTGYVACVFLPGGQLRVYELTMDAQAIQDLKLMREEARDFLDRIDLGDPPDVDWRPATRDALKHLHPAVDDTTVAIPKGMAQAWQAACGRYDTAKQRKALFENRIRERLGTGHKATTRAGDVVARRDVYDVKPHPVKGFHVDKLVPVKPKEPKP
jgi:putative phage-type endonuclease